MNERGDKQRSGEAMKRRRSAINAHSSSRHVHDSADRTPDTSRNELDELLERPLQEPSGAPDLTRSIMGRLGYMRVPAHVARRHRVRRWIARSFICLLAVTLIGLGIEIHNASPEARVPSEVTLPGAVSSDLQHHQHRMHDAWRVLQELKPTFDRVDWNEPTGAQDGATESLPPGGWEAPETLEDDSDSEFETPMFDEDVNRSAIGPVQWA